MEHANPLSGLQGLVEKVASEFDPSGYLPSEAMLAVDRWAVIERVACAAKLRAAAAAEDSGLDAEGLVASASRMKTGAARRQTRLRHKLRGKTRVADAFAKGKISETEANAISDAVDADPTAEESLLGLAAASNTTDVLGECERVRRNALDRDGSLAAKQRAARHVRTWTNSLGNLAFRGELEPVEGAKFVAELMRRANRLFREQTRDKSRVPDTPEQRNADALMEIVNGAGTDGGGDGGGGGSSPPPGTRPRAKRRGPRTVVRILVSEDALRRGAVEGDEKCETENGVEIPVAAAQAAVDDPDSKVQIVEVDGDGNVVRVDGVDIGAITSQSRYIPKALRDALEAGGIVCSVPGCGRTFGLQLDHTQLFSKLGPTELANLKWLCFIHHMLKTRGLMQTWVDDCGWHYGPARE